MPRSQVILLHPDHAPSVEPTHQAGAAGPADHSSLLLNVKDLAALLRVSVVTVCRHETGRPEKPSAVVQTGLFAPDVSGPYGSR
jgi:hypothetical protein